MATKKLTAGVLALSLLSGAAFAAEQTPTTGEQDLLAIASAGALTSASAGVQALSATEMDEVQGGGRLKISVKWKPFEFSIKYQR